MIIAGQSVSGNIAPYRDVLDQVQIPNVATRHYVPVSRFDVASTRFGPRFDWSLESLRKRLT